MKFLLIRRDNIGDLVCTTPFIHALRKEYPQAEICTLVNSYNQPVLVRNPDINGIYAYTKTKHRSKNQSLFSILFGRLQVTVELLYKKFDYAVVTASKFEPRAVKLAQLARPKHIVGFTDDSHPRSKHIDLGIPHTTDTNLHEVEDVFRLLGPLGIKAKPGPLHIYPDSAIEKKIRSTLPDKKKAIGIHISARKKSNQWDEKNFIELIEKLDNQNNVQFTLYWSPGDEKNPFHPGDDRKAEQIFASLKNKVKITPIATQHLEELIAGINVCDLFICSDGGAMHLAAALKKPIVCFFGGSGSSRWYPWATDHILLEPPTLKVNDIQIEEVVTACDKLMK